MITDDATSADGAEEEVDEAGDPPAAVSEIWPTFNTANTAVGTAPNANLPYTRPANPSPSQTRLNEK